MLVAVHTGDSVDLEECVHTGDSVDLEECVHAGDSVDLEDQPHVGVEFGDWVAGVHGDSVVVVPHE